MKNSIVKSLILAFAIAVAVGGVLFFIQTVVSPPDSIKQVEVHATDLQQFSASYNPGAMNLSEAEKMLDAIIDRATIYKIDSLIGQKVYDEAVGTSATRFAKTFVDWSFSKFRQSVWKSSDHNKMKKLINKLRGIIDQKSKYALPDSIKTIESVIKNYNSAWTAAKDTKFVRYEDVEKKCDAADKYLEKDYLKNCKSLVNAINSVRKKLEISRYHQLKAQVDKLQYLDSFKSKDDYDNSSKDVSTELGTFQDTDVFGSDANKYHAKELLTLVGIYDDRATAKAKKSNW
jgi:hypothetical protein